MEGDGGGGRTGGAAAAGRSSLPVPSVSLRLLDGGDLPRGLPALAADRRFRSSSMVEQPAAMRPAKCWIRAKGCGMPGTSRRESCTCCLSSEDCNEATVSRRCATRSSSCLARRFCRSSSPANTSHSDSPFRAFLHGPGHHCSRSVRTTKVRDRDALPCELLPHACKGTVQVATARQDPHTRLQLTKLHLLTQHITTEVPLDSPALA